MSTKETTVLIVEPDLDIQRVYRQKLIHDPNIQLIGMCSSAASAVAILSRVQCDVLFTELTLPDGNGTDLMVRAMTELNVKNCVVITSKRTPADVKKAIESGAAGYIIKGEPGSTEIASFVRVVCSGGSPISPSVAGMVIELLKSRRGILADKSTLVKGSGRSPLSQRETEIVKLLSQGKSFIEIGDELEISRHTVTAHVKKIYRKLQVHSRSEAVEEAVKRGLVDRL